jgi:hypothetical protein
VNLDRQIEHRLALGITTKLSMKDAVVPALDKELKPILFKGVPRCPIIPFNGRSLGDGGERTSHWVPAIGVRYIGMAFRTDVVSHVLNLGADIAKGRGEGQTRIGGQGLQRTAAWLLKKRLPRPPKNKAAQQDKAGGQGQNDAPTRSRS